MTDHVLDDLEAYTLGALDHASAERVASHLAVCQPCRAHAASLAEVVGALPDSVTLREPRPALRERVLARARTGAQAPEPARRSWSRGRVRVWPMVMAGLASIVIVLTAADVTAYRQLSALTVERDSYSMVVQSLRQGGRVWYMAGKDNFAGSGGTLFDPRADGKQPFVLFHDLPSIAAGKVLTVWLVSPDSTWARAATFTPDGRDVQAVPINTDVAGFDRCAVTLDDSPWGKHGTVVMESRIAPPVTTP
ncbi:MAG TPA: anti-sigma factor [Gemmatimonadota bacterium]|nr:anti-sigma factor [Gemmatimonadota bacterium]